MEADHSEQMLGCLLGGALGDSLGRSTEGAVATPLGETPKSPNTGELICTDDTQLTLATCEALIDSGGVDPESIARKMTLWFRAGKLSGLGSATYKALTELAMGGHWALVGRKGEMAHGNGAAMRIAPLAFCLSLDDPKARQTFRDVCRITHHSDEAYAGALAVATVIRSAYIGCLPAGDSLASGSYLASACRFLPDCRVRDRINELGALDEGVLIGEMARRFGCSGYVVESVPLAILAAERGHSTSFLQVIDEIVRAGGDTDTIASIAGQIMGTVAGYANLPPHLLRRLREGDQVLDIATRFATVVCGSSPLGSRGRVSVPRTPRRAS